MLRCEHIDIGYRKKTILRSVSAEAKKGEIIFIIGKNGSGKSSLIKSLAGVIPFLSGNCMIDGLALHEYSVQRRSRLISLISSHSDHIDYLKVKEYVAYGRMPYTNYLGTLTKEDEAIIDRALGQLNIERLKDEFITRISDGEFRKVQLARVICQQTDILLADEPVTHLDIGSKVEMFNLLKNLASDGKIVIVATHEIEMALRMANQVWLADDGEISVGHGIDLVRSGKLDDVFGNEFISFKKNELINFMHRVV